MSIPIRTPSWVSNRRLLERNLSNLPKLTNLNQIKQIQAQVLKHNLQADLYVTPKLISAFSLCHQMSFAIKVFNQVSTPNVHLYNTLIRGHVLNSEICIALDLFVEMRMRGLFPDSYTYTFLLKACDGPNTIRLVKMMHCHVEKLGFSKSDIYLSNLLVDRYCNCGSVASAVKLFNAMEKKDVVSWNSMISGLVKGGEFGEGRRFFEDMVEKDSVSWNIMLDGYAKCGEIDKAFELFERMPERNVVSWSTMVYGFSKEGDMDMARVLFEKMPVKSLVPWTIIISGYAEKGMAKEAIRLYDQMMGSGLKFDDATIISIMAACADCNLLGLGERVYQDIERSGYSCSIAVSNALVDMYAKSGSLERAFSIFKGMVKRDIVSWNAMIHGLAMHGHGEKAIQLFSRMTLEGLQPDRFTFIGVFCACTHASLVDKGLYYFDMMRREYGLSPQIEHYGCMIDLLGRGGRLKEALRLVKSMPMEPNSVIWGTLLSACQKHNAVDLAEEVLDRLEKLEPSNPGNYSLLSNIYAAGRKWNGVTDARLRMKSTGFQKPAGASSIEVDNEIYEFTVSDMSHPNSDCIYQTIGKLRKHLKLFNYIPKEQYSQKGSQHGLTFHDPKVHHFPHSDHMKNLHSSWPLSCNALRQITDQEKPSS